MTNFYPRGIALHRKLRRLAVEAGENPLTVGDGLNRLAAGGSGYGVPLLLLSLIGAIPVPTFGIKPLVGIIVVLLGLQMLVGKHVMWLPRWFIGARLRADWSIHAAHFGERFLPSLEHFVKPRINWMRYRLGSFLSGLAVICLGLIFILSLIPGAKILAGITLLVLSIGLIKNDGLSTLLAVLATLLLAVLHAEIIYLLVAWWLG